MPAWINPCGPTSVRPTQARFLPGRASNVLISRPWAAWKIECDHAQLGGGGLSSIILAHPKNACDPNAGLRGLPQNPGSVTFDLAVHLPPASSPPNPQPGKPAPAQPKVPASFKTRSLGKTNAIHCGRPMMRLPLRNLARRGARLKPTLRFPPLLPMQSQTPEKTSGRKIEIQNLQSLYRPAVSGGDHPAKSM